MKLAFGANYSHINTSDPAQYSNAVQMIRNLRVGMLRPNSGRSARNPATSQGWTGQPYSGYGIPFWIVFEFDAKALCSLVTGPPGGREAHFASPIRLPGANGRPTFFMQGYIDKVGPATAPDGDPAHVFKLFGRDIIDAVRRELLATWSRL